MAQAYGEHQSLLDPASGVLREDVFRYLLSQEVSRAFRYGEFFSVCLVGVSANGDLWARDGTLVRTVSRALADHVRTTDQVGLVSQTFGMLLLHVADQQARAVAQRLRSHISHIALPGTRAGSSTRVSVSIGGACFPQHGRTEPRLLEHASECLSAAERRGGNLVLYDPHGS